MLQAFFWDLPQQQQLLSVRKNYQVFQFRINRMSYNRVPDDFMKGKFMAPHTFNDPENPSHGQYVNLQLRNDLYFSTLEQISNIQFKFMSMFSSDQWIQVEKIKECEDRPQTWLQNFSNQYKQSRGKTIKQDQNRKVELLNCEEWRVAYHSGDNKRLSNYRVHILQSNTDIFKSQIFPQGFYKTAKDLLIN